MPDVPHSLHPPIVARDAAGAPRRWPAAISAVLLGALLSVGSAGPLLAQDDDADTAFIPDSSAYPIATPADTASYPSADTIVTVEEIPTFGGSDSNTTVWRFDSSVAAGAAILQRDSSRIAMRRPADSALARFLADDDFTYDREQVAPETFMQRLRRWFKSLIDSLVGHGTQGVIIEWIFYTIMAFALVYVVMKLLGSDIRSLFLKGNPNRVSPFAELEEDIHEMNFDELIDQAAASAQYRRAVRLLYLKGLKALADKGAIAWRKDRTNHDYLHDLRDSALRAPFVQATQLFEYVWYGDMPLGESIFRDVRSNLEGFIANVHGRS